MTIGQIRLGKYLGEMGMGTRSQLREAVKKGRILVSGEIEGETERKIVPGSDVVPFDGQPVSHVKMEYYMLSKPQGMALAAEDKRHQAMVEPAGGRKRDGLFPVGRLDINTEGLLLIADDGNLAHRLLSPEHHVGKVYFARIERELPAGTGERLAQGVTLTGDTPTLPAKPEIQKQGGGESKVLLTIHEGKFYQVKRIFEALGCRVVYLRRMLTGPLVLGGELQPGKYRALSGEEPKALKNIQVAEGVETKRQDNRKERHHVR